jgi:hypothetical protein
MRGHGGDAQAGADVEADAIGEPDDAFGGQIGVLLRRAGRPFVASKVDPDPVAKRQTFNSLANGVDNAGAVLVGSDLCKGQ